MALTLAQEIRIRRAVEEAQKAPARKVLRRLGEYVPNNNALFNAAYGGFLAGAYEGKATTLASPSAYAGIVAQAQVFAETVDGALAAGSYSAGQAACLGNLCQGIMANKYSIGISDAQLAPFALAIVALFTEALPGFYTEAGPGGNATSIQGVPVAPTTPVNDAVLVFDQAAGQYDVRPLTQDDIQAGFAITSFTGGETVEIGASVVNPTFHATYTSEPASATLTNTDGTDSPLALTAPFTTATVTGTFTKAATATVGFTLSAVGSETDTAGQSLVWNPRVFAGLGAAGATGATASGTNADLTGAAGTLASAGLSANVDGASFGPLVPADQKIYLLLPHTSSPHTFTDQNGFPFAMNAPRTIAFVNQNAVAVSMDLYESTNLLATSFTLTVAS